LLDINNVSLSSVKGKDNMLKNQIINILIVDDNKEYLDSLYNILRSATHNIFKANTKQSAKQIIKDKKFALIICSVNIKGFDFFNFIDFIKSEPNTQGSFIIATAFEGEQVYNLVKGMKKGAVDYLLRPYIPNLVKAKIDVYKRLYFKNKQITNLLENILPLKTLEEFNKFGKSTPKKINNCSILFTDFVGFSDKASKLLPKELIHKLDYYFTKFDEIIIKYGLEKIKTIGDAYMAVGGVSITTNTELRTALAALDIRNFIENEIITLKAFGIDYWDIRIGVHSGDLIAGVIGSHKFSFDVWGDSVNIAARCEQNSIPGQINISSHFYSKINPYFNAKSRGEIKIKNIGKIDMYFLENIKPEYSLYNKGLKPNFELRKLINLSNTDFDDFKSFIINKLKAELSDDLFYHSVEHTLNVEKASIKYAELEGVDQNSLLLLRTAALFHDSGFLISYNDNESIGVKILEKYAFEFGYSIQDIKTISSMIIATNNKVQPITLCEKILCDADHDYLGRADYHHIANKLLEELKIYDKDYTEKEWLEKQIGYLEDKHQYHSTSAFNLRQIGKENRITELKVKLEQLV